MIKSLIHSLQLTRLVIFLFFFSGLLGCALLAHNSFEKRFGPPVSDRFDNPELRTDTLFQTEIQPLLDRRCVVCHACNDAPCQLKLGSYEGLTRGASKNKIYNAKRLTAAKPSRLFEDAQNVSAWRQAEFFPVLNEFGDNSGYANVRASLLARVLQLKESYPQPTTELLPESFDLRLNRDEQCPTIEEFSAHATKYSLWGMPYALPGLDKHQQQVLENWISNGAAGSPEKVIPEKLQKQVEQWERFFNQGSLKGQLVSRYLYEHLFLAHLWFSEKGEPTFFKLIRSQTPPGQAPKIINTRVPFGDPMVKRVYYRLIPVVETISQKTHMPYRLDKKRQQFWRSLFFESEYEVTALPNYELEKAANPFGTFKQIPVRSRYKFLLEEAEFTIMGFIKGPVCRGQTALNVINDYFWVTFANPDLDIDAQVTEFLAEEMSKMSLPAGADSTSSPLLWLRYAEQEKHYIQAKTRFINEHIAPQIKFDLSLLWNGGGKNSNANLTVYRHYDSATVTKGLHGDTPQSAWLITYPILERIHYLLVAGFDVYGNIGHQLNTRIYMDFLRMEGEYNFLALLPKENRKEVREHWYRGKINHVENYLTDQDTHFMAESDIKYKTQVPLAELYSMIKNKMQAINNGEYALSNGFKNYLVVDMLERLNRIKGKSTVYLPETATIELVDKKSGQRHYYTLLHHRAFENVSHVFNQKHYRLEDEDQVSILYGFVGAYPSVLLEVEIDKLNEFVSAIEAFTSEDDYSLFLDDYGVRRTNPGFWAVSDRMHDAFKKTKPIEYGLFDYNRLENR